MNLRDKIVVIAGGADGIGFDIAKKYIIGGAKTVTIVDIDRERGEKARDYIIQNYGKNKADFICCDVSKDLDDTYNKIMQKHDAVDVLINCVVTTKEDSPKLMIDVSLTALVEWNIKFSNHMRKDNNGKGGTIVNISSILGYRASFIGPVYHAIKYGIVGFTRSLGHPHNFGNTGVRVIAICPGFTETKLTKELFESSDIDIINEVKKYDRQPVGAVGDAAVDIFERAASGTIWLVEGGRPAEEIQMF